MFDKNGKEIKTGMAVRVSGAYFKKDNGLYFVDRSLGEASWLEHLCTQQNSQSAHVCYSSNVGIPVFSLYSVPES